MVEIHENPLGDVIVDKNGGAEVHRIYFKHSQSGQSIEVDGITGREYVEERTIIKPVAVVKVTES